MAKTPENLDLADDLLWGAAAIAAALGLPRAKVYWLLENGKLPARKVGWQWVTSRTKLAAALRPTQGAAA